MILDFTDEGLEQVLVELDLMGTKEVHEGILDYHGYSTRGEDKKLMVKDYDDFEACFTFMYESKSGRYFRFLAMMRKLD